MGCGREIGSDDVTTGCAQDLDGVGSPRHPSKEIVGDHLGGINELLVIIFFSSMLRGHQTFVLSLVDFFDHADPVSNLPLAVYAGLLVDDDVRNCRC